QLVEKDPLLLSFDDLGLIDSMHPVYVWGPHYFHLNRNGHAETSPLDGEILRTTFDQVWPWAITDDEMAIAIPTEGLANQGALTMQDLVLLNMIKNRPLHGREIYFAGTVAPESRQFLEHYQEMEGIAFRVTEYPVVDAVNSARGWQLMESYRFTGVMDPTIYKCDQAVQLLKNYVSAYHRLAYHYLAIGEPDSVQMALDRAEQLFITLPDAWAEVLPSRARIIANLVDGLYGPEAASDTLFILAEQSLEAAREMGDQELMQFSLAIANMATGTDVTFSYRRKMEYRNLFDIIDNGSIPFAWMKLEVSLMFSDYLGAWNILDNMEIPEDTYSVKMAELARNTLENILEDSMIGAGVNIYDTGLFVFFESIDQSTSIDLDLKENVSAGNIIDGMIRLASKDHIMSAISAGLVLAEYIEDETEARIINEFVLRILEDDHEVTREWAEWYMIEENRVSPEALAWMAAKGGRPFLMYAALSKSSYVSESTISEILTDPASYAGYVPDPGNGAGRYSWVNTLDGGS
ncbi:MAG: hypothetical protein KAT09_05460, partial [Candidatus Aegiribacteria sp.]|nr:hypothetical protein [Candidatus Aegiribacteria sp.]